MTVLGVVQSVVANDHCTHRQAVMGNVIYVLV